MQISEGDHVRSWSSSTRNKLNLGLDYELKIHIYSIKDGQWLKLQEKADPVFIGPRAHGASQQLLRNDCSTVGFRTAGIRNS